MIYRNSQKRQRGGPSRQKSKPLPRIDKPNMRKEFRINWRPHRDIQIAYQYQRSRQLFPNRLDGKQLTVSMVKIVFRNENLIRPETKPNRF